MRSLAALGLTALLALISSEAQAAGLPITTSATVDYTHGTLTVNGQNFGRYTGDKLGGSPSRAVRGGW
jgi:hypothetical protein